MSAVCVEGSRAPGAGVTGGYKLPDVGAGKLSPVTSSRFSLHDNHWFHVPWGSPLQTASLHPLSDHGCCHPKVELSTLLNILGSEFCAAGPGLRLQFPESTDVRAAPIPCGEQCSARKELLYPASRRPPTQAPALCWAPVSEPTYSSFLLCEAIFLFYI